MNDTAARANGRGRLVLRAFHQLYGPFSFAHDPIAWLVSRGRWWLWGRTALDWLDTEGPILEIGPGTGRLMEQIASSGRSIIGVDRSPHMLSKARRRMAHRGHEFPSVGFVMADARKLPFAANTFASAVSTFPAPALLSDSALAEVGRVIKSNAVFAVVLGAVPGGWRPWDVLARLALGSSGGSLKSRLRETNEPQHAGYSDDHHGQQQPPGAELVRRATAVGLSASVFVRHIYGDAVWVLVMKRPESVLRSAHKS